MKSILKRYKALIEFTGTLLIAIILFVIGAVRVNKFNNTVHYETLSGDILFSDTYGTNDDFSIHAIPRGSTWSKAFDLITRG